ncbi:hypothetical protein [uncultured Reyranella sp.]|uniref:hypothetical protein n=1 Tax=uncultured Reyranella sp. TaxID=735512 RepID=UPI0025CCE1F7|nr:hypothetical protein [uncultured Reyranella sp.]
MTELNEIDVGIRLLAAEGVNSRLRLWAVEWVFEVSLSLQKDRLVIVRIGRLDDPKISSACRAFILDRKAIAWSEVVRKRAESFIRVWN